MNGVSIEWPQWGREAAIQTSNERRAAYRLSGPKTGLSGLSNKAAMPKLLVWNYVAVAY